MNSSSKRDLEIMLSPQKFIQLLDNNFISAVEFLLNILPGSSSSSENSYLTALMSLPPSLKTLDCINRLALKELLSDEFLLEYLRSSTLFCLDSNLDTSQQHRLARLVIVWAQSLFRNKNLPCSGEVFLQLQQLCTNVLGRVNEAASLLKLLNEIRNTCE
ncbi:hypothetical protein GEMRC1_011121 [Eukaryota sp. GEM-RC1]